MKGVSAIFRPPSPNLPQRKITWIYTNGKTEKNYFDLQKIAHKDKRNLKICPICKEGRGIKNILEKIKRECDGRSLRSGDKIFCVVDVDALTDMEIQGAFRIKPKYVELILSNPDFELWLLLHFQQYNTRITKDETMVKVRNHLHEYCKPEIEPFFSRLRENEQIAITNARLLRRQHLGGRVDLNSRGANPHTFVDNIIEFLNTP